MSSRNKVHFVPQSHSMSHGQEEQSMLSTTSREQLHAYAYELLSDEETAAVAEKISTDTRARTMLDQIHTEKALLKQWEDVPVPVGLADRTIARIQQNMSNATND